MWLGIGLFYIAFLILIFFLGFTLQVTISGFRSGKFMTLVATNVAARGLDINDVQLIIQVGFRFLLLPNQILLFKLR